MGSRWEPIRCPKCGQDHDAREVYIYAGELSTVYHEESEIDRRYYAGQYCQYLRALAAEKQEAPVAEKLYKLTDQASQTYGGCQWGPGVEHTASGDGELCNAGWLHAYTDPLLAVLLDPIHQSYWRGPRPRLWEAEGDIGKKDHGLKVGCTRLRTVREVSLPKVRTEQWVRFGILTARQVYQELGWVHWADRWLSGADRSVSAAENAASEAEDVAWAARAGAARAWAARESTEEAVAWSARAWAADSAAEAARGAELACGPESAGEVGAKSAGAAEAAAWAAARAGTNLNLVALAEEAAR